MRKFRLLAATISLAVTAASAANPAPAAPPIAEKKPVSDQYFDVTVVDNYRWLEDRDSPETQRWVAAEDQYARGYLESLPAYAPLEQRLTTLMRGTSPYYEGLSTAGGKLFGRYVDPKAQQPAIVTLDANADPATRHVVLDPNKLDVKGLTAIDWFVPSHDGRLVAVSLSKNGSEDGTLHIYESATGQETGETIPRVQYPTAGGSLAWAADNKGFWYTRYPDENARPEDRHFNLQVYFHTLGQDWRKDPLVLGTADGLPRIAEIFLYNRYAPDVVLASVQKGDGGEWQQWVLGTGGKKRKVSDFADQVVCATIGTDHALYMISINGAPNGKVLKLAPAATQLSQATIIVPESDAAMQISAGQEALSLSRSQLYVTYIVGGPNEVRSHGLDGKGAHKIALPDIAAFDNLVTLDDGDLLIEVSSYLTPDRYMRVRNGKAEATKLAKTSPAKFDDAEVLRIFATSKDGTRVPVNIVRKKGTPLNGRNPTLLYGYGGYGVSTQPYFVDANVRTWLDAGGVYAEANIRGGAEFGERWHTGGNLTKKQNVFDDFAAAAQELIQQKYTDSAHLALRGGSNGGLLMGAMITQHPDLAHAVVSHVGIYDMLRVELDPNGSFNTTEFGSVKDPAQFRALYAYSPYHHVKSGTPYPAVLMMTGENDGRVNPMQSRKFTAALQAATSSHQVVLLRINKSSGHGIGNSISERIEEAATWMSFLFAELGMSLPSG
ncbi:MAG TPA: prolyl oligopeptidase family serine peptidase [Povalibacter sp.]|nr:prolyl oligopeptidase family serine peptidase [Povalibacter sp.]